MPVEINELVIKATVAERCGPNADNTAGNAGKNKDGALKPVEESVQKIIEILKRKNER